LKAEMGKQVLEEVINSTISPKSKQLQYDEFRGLIGEFVKMLFNISYEIREYKKNQVVLDRNNAYIMLKGFKEKTSEINTILKNGGNTKAEMYLRNSFTPCVVGLAPATKLAMEGDYSELEKKISELKYHSRTLIDITRNNSSYDEDDSLDMERKMTVLTGMGYTQEMVTKALQLSKGNLEGAKNWLMENNRQSVSQFPVSRNTIKPASRKPIPKNANIISPKYNNQYEFTLDSDFDNALASIDEIQKDLKKEKRTSYSAPLVPVIPLDNSTEPIRSQYPISENDKNTLTRTIPQRKSNVNRTVHRRTTEPIPEQKSNNNTLSEPIRSASAVITPPSWNCVKCKQTNKPEALKCYMCGNPLLSQEQIKEVGDSKHREELEKRLQTNDLKWSCNTCSVLNGKNLEKCHMCGSSRPTNGSVMAEEDKFSTLRYGSTKVRRKIKSQREANIQLPY